MDALRERFLSAKNYIDVNKHHIGAGRLAQIQRLMTAYERVEDIISAKQILSDIEERLQAITNKYRYATMGPNINYAKSPPERELISSIAVDAELYADFLFR